MDKAGEKELLSGGLCGPGSHGVLSYRKWKPLKGLKPGMRTLDLHFGQIIMATEEELMVSSLEGGSSPLRR